jgi:hypothetical protein
VVFDSAGHHGHSESEEQARAAPTWELMIILSSRSQQRSCWRCARVLRRAERTRLSPNSPFFTWQPAYQSARAEVFLQQQDRVPLGYRIPVADHPGAERGAGALTPQLLKDVWGEGISR